VDVIMRFWVFLCLGLITAGCAPPLEITIPQDHPANPQAISEAPEVDLHHYVYSLPSPPTGTMEEHKDPSPQTKPSREGHKGMSHSTTGKTGHPEQGG
jgi:hypothetical protein